MNYNYIEKNFEQPAPTAYIPDLPEDISATNDEIKNHIVEYMPLIRSLVGGKSKSVVKRWIRKGTKTIKGYQEDNIQIKIYYPINKTENCGCMLFAHGGAWVAGNTKSVEQYCKAVADSSDIVVVSVEYRYAPEFPFPCSLADCYYALEWIWDNYKHLEIDKNKIIVSGDSAGGNIAAALCFLAKDMKKIKISSQVLIYPAVSIDEKGIPDPTLINTKLTGRISQIVTELYLGDVKDYQNPYISPINAKNHENLPKALIAISEFDGLMQQGKDYAQKLYDSGNDVTLIMFKNTAHGFIERIGTAPQALELANEVAKFLAK